MQKALAARVPIVASVSAPSGLAAHFAEESGQTLVGFLRGRRMNVYAPPRADCVWWKLRSGVLMLDSESLSSVTLAILAGGEGSRMGMPKGELRVGGTPILRYLLERFRWAGPTLLVTAPGREHPPGWEAFTREVYDPIDGLGPLRGVLTALEHSIAEHVLVTPVDMPGLAGIQLRWVASAFAEERSRGHDVWGLMTCRQVAEGAEPGSPISFERKIEPFPAVFHREAAPAIRARLAAGRGSVYALADEPGCLVVPAPGGWSESTWVNLNRHADLNAFLIGRST